MRAKRSHGKDLETFYQNPNANSGLKHLYRFSDDDMVDFIRRDLYAQYLCDVSFGETVKFIHPTTLVKFRKKIGLTGIKLIEEEVLNSLKRAKLLKGRKLVCDTTVVPSDSSYPIPENCEKGFSGLTNYERTL